VLLALLSWNSLLSGITADVERNSAAAVLINPPRRQSHASGLSALLAAAIS
jgi:hypothetical protein